MHADRPDSRMRERVRGVGYVVALGVAVLLVGLGAAALFAWMAG